MAQPPLYEDDLRNEKRNEVTDALMKPPVTPNTPLSRIASAIPTNLAQQFTTSMPGMPQTPAGGVPGSGLAPAGPSTLQLPPQRLGVAGELAPIGSKTIKRRGY